MKTLLDLIEEIDQLDPEEVIFARTDWRPNSDAAVFRLAQDYGVPEEPTQLGLKYFLEVSVAREVLEGFVGKPSVSSIEKCARLIRYAINDA